MSSNPDQGEVYSKQHYVIKIISDFRTCYYSRVSWYVLSAYFCVAWNLVLFPSPVVRAVYVRSCCLELGIIPEFRDTCFPRFCCLEFDIIPGISWYVLTTYVCCCFWFVLYLRIYIVCFHIVLLNLSIPRNSNKREGREITHKAHIIYSADLQRTWQTPINRTGPKIIE